MKSALAARNRRLAVNTGVRIKIVAGKPLLARGLKKLTALGL